MSNKKRRFSKTKLFKQNDLQRKKKWFKNRFKQNFINLLRSYDEISQDILWYYNDKMPDYVTRFFRGIKNCTLFFNISEEGKKK